MGTNLFLCQFFFIPHISSSCHFSMRGSSNFHFVGGIQNFEDSMQVSDGSNKKKSTPKNSPVTVFHRQPIAIWGIKRSESIMASGRGLERNIFHFIIFRLRAHRNRILLVIKKLHSKMVWIFYVSEKRASPISYLLDLYLYIYDASRPVWRWRYYPWHPCVAIHMRCKTTAYLFSAATVIILTLSLFRKLYITVCLRCDSSSYTLCVCALHMMPLLSNVMSKYLRFEFSCAVLCR